MLKCILGLMRVDEGRILVDGEDVTRMSGRELQRVRGRFGMLFQGGALFDSLPVWRNVTFALSKGSGGHAAEMRRIALENIEKVGLGAEVLDLRPSELSRSEEQTSELQALMRISYAVVCLKKKTKT